MAKIIAAKMTGNDVLMNKIQRPLELGKKFLIPDTFIINKKILSHSIKAHKSKVAKQTLFVDLLSFKN